MFVKEAVKDNRLVWVVYQDKHHIIDCNISTNIHDLNKFDKKFRSHGKDVIRNESHENGKAAKHSTDVDFRGLLRQCRLFKKQVRALRIEHHHEEHGDKRSKRNQHDKDDINAGSRQKRGASLMIVPGTNWCGAGDRASGYEDLGEHAATDRCCREHDHCPYYIGALTTKYNYFNRRLCTLSHCTCEEKWVLHPLILIFSARKSSCVNARGTMPVRSPYRIGQGVPLVQVWRGMGGGTP